MPAVLHRLSVPLVAKCGNNITNQEKKHFTDSPTFLFFNRDIFHICVISTKDQPDTLICLLCSPFLILLYLAVDVAPPVLVPGDRFWLCQACKGPDLDTMWYSRISCSRDYSQQGKRQVIYQGGEFYWSCCIISGLDACCQMTFEDFCIDLFDIMVSIFSPTFLPVYNRGITKQWTGGHWAYWSMRWQQGTRHFLLTNQFRFMKRLYQER